MFAGYLIALYICMILLNTSFCQCFCLWLGVGSLKHEIFKSLESLLKYQNHKSYKNIFDD